MIKNGNPAEVLNFALPNKGALGDDALNFLANAGLRVHKPNERQYAATVPSLPGVHVVFQRPVDIFRKINDGSADLGITGYDVMREHEDESGDVVVVEHLGFGACELVVAVPDSWIDVSSLSDLTDLSLMYKEKGREIRIATKYRHLTREWLYEKGITRFTLVNAEGALEAAPNMGYADMIVDISATGTTLKENRLKVLEGGTILASDAVLIANRRNLTEYAEKRKLTRHILELIEAHQRSRKYLSIVANMRGESAQQVGDLLIGNPLLRGLVGPGIMEIRAKESGEAWYSINIIIEKPKLLDVMENLRAVGCTDITVMQLGYIFKEKSYTFERLEELLNAK